ncbi:MAG: hypothetical protein HKO65_14900 [Gemmatimonadetes bacterium]|nr:hypothetical protein [Gemmatimonadota bacterium]
MQLGVVDLDDDHPRPEAGVVYDVVSASSQRVGRIPVPESSYRRLHLDLYEFYVDDLPDFLSKKNEGLLKIQASTKNPQDLGGSMTDAAFVSEFKAKDGSYAPSFLYRGVFRNVVIQGWVTLSFELYELDSDASEYYGKIKGVIDNVPEIKNLDILKGLPYLNLATQLFDGIITTFGRNADDHLWGELPILEIQPTPGGAFLRTGIYLLAEKTASNGKLIELGDLQYKDGRIQRKKGKRLPNHLLFGMSLVEHRGEST